MKKQSAFTLLETLLVLLVVSLFVMLPAVTLKNAKESLEVRHFLDHFEKEILLTQQTAITSAYMTKMIQSDSRRQYYFYADETLRLDLPEDLTASKVEPVYFKGSSGNNSSLQSLNFYWEKENKKITYRFKFARGHYEKEITVLH